jgi:hypothetical protein
MASRSILYIGSVMDLGDFDPDPVSTFNYVPYRHVYDEFFIFIQISHFDLVGTTFF